MIDDREADDNWVTRARTCAKCRRERERYEYFGGVYARGVRLAVCFECYGVLAVEPVVYRKQAQRYRAEGI